MRTAAIKKLSRAEPVCGNCTTFAADGPQGGLEHDYAKDYIGGQEHLPYAQSFDLELEVPSKKSHDGFEFTMFCIHGNCSNSSELSGPHWLAPVCQSFDLLLMSADLLKEGLRVWTHNPLETSQVYSEMWGLHRHRFVKALTFSFWSSGVSKVDLEASELTTLERLYHFPSESAGVYRLAWVCQGFDLQLLVKWHI